jgi:hypothetical protein
VKLGARRRPAARPSRGRLSISGQNPVRLIPVFNIALTAPGATAEDTEKTAVFHYSNVKTVTFFNFLALGRPSD